MIDIPKFHEFFSPILEVLKDKGETSAHEAAEIVVKKVGLTDEQLAVAQESNGRSVAKNRIHIEVTAGVGKRLLEFMELVQLLLGGGLWVNPCML